MSSNMSSKKVMVPPHSREAELSVLGAVLLDKDAVIAVSEFLKPEHFYEPIHADIFEAVLTLYENRSSIDVVTVAEALKKKKKLKIVGGRAYLSSLVAEVPTAAHAEEYGRIVKDLSAKRELISAAARINELAFAEGGETDELLDKAEQEIFTLSQRHIRDAPSSLRDILTASFDRLDELQKMGTGLRGMATGFTDLDNLLAGMQDANLLILAARPGIGKSTMALNIARYVAVEAKLPVCYFSLEMSKEELVDRLLVRQGGLDAWKMKTGKLNDNDLAHLSEAMGMLADAPLFIDDTAALSVLELRTRARRLQAEQGLRLIVVDYLQLMRGKTTDNRVQEVSEISQGLKALAKELKLPILAAAQLSRAVEVRGGFRPRLADLRESGSIEQDADVVAFLYREDEENKETLVCEVSKHRNGPVGLFKLFFNSKLVSFFGMDQKKE